MTGTLDRIAEEFDRFGTLDTRDVLALVEVAKAAQPVCEEWEWPAEDGTETEFHDRVVDLAAALARLEDNQ